jgi:hypothetical protein
MWFKETLSVDEAEVLAGRFSSVSGRYYILYNREKLAEKYKIAWNNFGIKIFMLYNILMVNSFLSKNW